MVFELIINPIKAEKQPYDMFFIGAFYSSLAVLLSLWIFREQASMVMVFLTVLASVHIINGVLMLEEDKDMKIRDEKILIKEHGKALSFFIFLFLGFTVGYLFWNLVLPQSISNSLFEVQRATITEINSRITTGAIITGGVANESASLLTRIFYNNIKVLIFCLLFSLFYGSGAIFILAWNASVIATAMGNVVRLTIGRGIVSSVGYAIAKYMTHGIMEIAAYFVAGLAGGIISIAIIRHEVGTEGFIRVMLDSVDLIVMSIFMLAVAAVVEVYVTPSLF